METSLLSQMGSDERSETLLRNLFRFPYYKIIDYCRVDNIAFSTESARKREYWTERLFLLRGD
jgi:hypothetical protein